MRKSIMRTRLLFVLFAAALAVTAGSAWAGPVPSNSKAAGPDLKAMELGNGLDQNTGELQFTNDELVFTSSEGQAESLSLQYANLRKVEFKAPRLLKIETKNGEHKEFTTVGAEKFDSNTVAYLKDHVGSRVEFKSYIR